MKIQFHLVKNAFRENSQNAILRVLYSQVNGLPKSPFLMKVNRITWFEVSFSYVQTIM